MHAAYSLIHEIEIFMGYEYIYIYLCLQLYIHSHTKNLDDFNEE